MSPAARNNPPPTASAAVVNGRGSVSNATGRYEAIAREAFDDGWTPDEHDAPRTEATPDATRTIITFNQSPDIGFDRSINPYRGCEHGCSYCFARPTHAFLGLSPGLDFETKLLYKPDAARLLRGELRAKSYRPRVIAMGTNTDPYQPLERSMGITRSILEVLRDFSHPVSIVTKSNLIVRDVDILGPMAARRLAIAALSVTTLDRRLARAMEPRAATPERRLDAIRALTQAGVPTTVLIAPVIPGLNDHELEAIAEAAAAAGAQTMGYVLLRLPLEIKDLFREWLEAHVPDRARRVIKLLREMRGGKDYDAKWFERQRGNGPFAKLIADRARAARTRFKLDTDPPPYDMTLFKPPPAPGDQLMLL